MSWLEKVKTPQAASDLQSNHFFPTAGRQQQTSPSQQQQRGFPSYHSDPSDDIDGLGGQAQDISSRLQQVYPMLGTAQPKAQQSQHSPAAHQGGTSSWQMASQDQSKPAPKPQSRVLVLWDMDVVTHRGSRPMTTRHRKLVEPTYEKIIEVLTSNDIVKRGEGPADVIVYVASGKADAVHCARVLGDRAVVEQLSENVAGHLGLLAPMEKEVTRRLTNAPPSTDVQQTIIFVAGQDRVQALYDKVLASGHASFLLQPDESSTGTADDDDDIPEEDGDEEQFEEEEEEDVQPVQKAAPAKKLPAPAPRQNANAEMINVDGKLHPSETIFPNKAITYLRGQPLRKGKLCSRQHNGYGEYKDCSFVHFLKDVPKDIFETLKKREGLPKKGGLSASEATATTAKAAPADNVLRVTERAPIPTAEKHATGKRTAVNVCGHDVPLKELLDNAGVKWALANGRSRWCKGLPMCTDPLSCDFMHRPEDLLAVRKWEEEQKQAERKKRTDPKRVFVIDGESITYDRLEDNAGKQYAIDHPHAKLKWCRGHPSHITAKECTYMHRRK